MERYTYVVEFPRDLLFGGFIERWLSASILGSTAFSAIVGFDYSIAPYIVMGAHWEVFIYNPSHLVRVGG